METDIFNLTVKIAYPELKYFAFGNIFIFALQKT